MARIAHTGLRDSADAELQQLVRDTAASRDADMYADLWAGAATYKDIPPLTRAHLARVLLSRRRYKNARALTRAVDTPHGTFLCEWAFDDIAREPWGITTERPMVCMRDPQDAVEKAVWCYEHGMLPLIGETDADVAVLTARKYEIDSLITDCESLALLWPYLSSREEPLASLTVVGARFPEDVRTLPLKSIARHARLVIALPETGVIAEADFSTEPAFAIAAGCVWDQESRAFTKLSRLVTPMIKYILPDDIDL